MDRMKREYGIIVRQEEPSRLMFSMESDGMELELASRAAAMRRNPPAAIAGRPPCMADIARVETGLISAISAKEERSAGLAAKLVSGALEYQNQMQVPVCLAEPDSAVSGADFLEGFGFQYIYDRPRYVLNTGTISVKMLERAARGESVSLDIPDMTLRSVVREDMLSLAHFVNARLCRQYGFFLIRSASYYERVQEKLLDRGGSLFQVMENGIRKGYFASVDIASGSIGEAVFAQDFDRECYLLTEKGKRPAIMARIVNLPEMLRHVAGNGKITIALRISDPVIAENDGMFLWYLDEDGSRMERVEEQDGAPEVTATIGAFTAFIFEYMVESMDAHMKWKQNAKFDSIYLAGPAFLTEGL